MNVTKDFYKAPQLELMTLAARRCVAMSLGGTTEGVADSTSSTDASSDAYTEEDGNWGN